MSEKPTNSKNAQTAESGEAAEPAEGVSGMYGPDGQLLPVEQWPLRLQKGYAAYKALARELGRAALKANPELDPYSGLSASERPTVPRDTRNIH